MKKLILLITMLPAVLISAYVKAQGHFDAFSATYAISEGNQYEQQNNEAGIEDISVNVKVPQEKGNGNVEVFGMMLNSLYINNDNSEDIRCWSAGLNYSYVFRNEKRSLQLTFIPKVNSDFENGSRDVLQLGGVVLATRKSSERFKYKYGLYYNHECFGHFFVPLAGFEWKVNNSWQVYGTLPMNATVACRITKRLVTGFNFTGIIASFRLKNDQYLHKSSNELYGFADIYIAKNLLLQGRVGYGIARSYRLYEAGDEMDFGISALKFGDDRRQVNDDLKDGSLLQASLIYRVRTNK